MAGHYSAEENITVIPSKNVIQALLAFCSINLSNCENEGSMIYKTIKQGSVLLSY